MNVLVVAGGRQGGEPPVQAARALAGWSSGSWKVAQASGPSSPECSDIDVIVTGVDAPHSRSLDALVDASSKPILVVKRPIDRQPRRFVLVSEAHDLDHAVLEPAVSWLRRSLGPVPAEQPHVPLRVDLVHVIRPGAEWHVASADIVPQLEQCLEQPHVIFSSARPALADELPHSLAGLRADVVIAFQDVDPVSGRHRLGALARRILDGSDRPVLLLPPGRRLAAAAQPEDNTAVAAL